MSEFTEDGDMDNLAIWDQNVVNITQSNHRREYEGDVALWSGVLELALLDLQRGLW